MINETHVFEVFTGLTIQQNNLKNTICRYKVPTHPVRIGCGKKVDFFF